MVNFFAYHQTMLALIVAAGSGALGGVVMWILKRWANADIMRAALADPDNQPLTDADFARMKPKGSKLSEPAPSPRLLQMNSCGEPDTKPSESARKPE